MEFVQPRSWQEALAAKAEYAGAVAIAGGTDVMVELNFDKHRPPALIDLTRVEELRQWDTEGDRIRLGSGVSYTRVIEELGDRLPGLAMASRTVGSPQIRNRGTVGGNLGAASPAGDCHPALLAAAAEIELQSVDGTRVVPIDEFYLGVKRHAGTPNELISAIYLTPPSGPQQFSKIGTRNAMVISVASFGLALHPDREEVRTGIGSVAPTPRRAHAAEEFIKGELADQWQSPGQLPDGLAQRFGELVKSAGAPIDDVRGTAAYRLHSLEVMARRSLVWAWTEYLATKG